MPVRAIVGAQWGDEGKGKITDLLAQDADVVMRYGGGSNAGHTVVNASGEFKLHAMPSGVFNPDAISLIGTGSVVDFPSLLSEIAHLAEAGIDAQGLRISSRAHVVMPYHVLLDRLGDEARGSMAVGTTRKGVGPTYVDKADRVGIQVADVLDERVLRTKLDLVLSQKNRVLRDLYGHEPLDIEMIIAQAATWRERFADRVVDQVALLAELLAANRRILLEGQLGALRDLDWGTYPYVTSSTTIAGGGAVGGGIPPMFIDSVVGVVKAYTTAVGAGPLPAELHDETGDDLRRRGGEYGATTGRPRRIGWFDAVATRYACLLNRFTGIAVTKLDVLDGMPSLRICTAYVVDGQTYTTVPSTAVLERAEPVYEEIAGWDESTRDLKSWDDLPPNARAYIERIETLVGAPVNIVSVGQSRDQTIIYSPLRWSSR
ncbi:MAG: adenylosuccinate synthase [Chloroflexota bacterium]